MMDFFARHTVIKKLALHALFWLLILSYFGWGFSAASDFATSFINMLWYLPGFMLLVYSLIYYLIPVFLTRKKYWQFLSLLLLVLLLCLLYSELVKLVLQSKVFNGVTMNEGREVLPYIHVAGIAISINLLNYWYRQKQQTIEAQQQKTAAELELLKSQVHPHFLFNTLNNLYAHILDQSPMAPEIVLKLSGLLRFMIYESSVPLIPLAAEIKLLQEYISLEQLRYGDRLDVSLAVTGQLEGKQIAPLLILPLIENAFKHGTSNQTEQCWISFDMHVTDQGMHFKLVNSKEAGPVTRVFETGGIGLQNVKKRLDLLYPGKHSFAAEHDKDVFIVNLYLQWAPVLSESTSYIIANPSINHPDEMEMSAG
jgi:sensor histidine kinase YesM